MTKNIKKTKDAQITDMLLDDFDKFEHFTVTYLKQIIAACVIIIVIVSIATIAYTMHCSAESKADNAIANAKTIEALQAVIKEYPGRKAIWTAHQNLVKLYIDKKDFAQAYAQTREFLKLNLPDELRVQLELNMGYMLENSGKKRDAADKFIAISNDSAYPAGVRIEAAYSAGRLESDLGNKAAAKKYLEAAVKNTAGAAAGESGLWQKLAMSMLMNMDKPKAAAAPAPVKTTLVKPVAATKTAVKGSVKK